MKAKKEQNLELKYTGSLDGAKTIYLHYGIGDNWDGISECKMRKLKSCYKTEVTIPAGAELKFCFRDTEGNWDNNFGNDYSYAEVTGETPMNIYSSVEVNTYTPKIIK